MGADDKTEASIVVSSLEAILSWLLPVSPTSRQIVNRMDLVVDDCSLIDLRAHDLKTSGDQLIEQDLQLIRRQKRRRTLGGRLIHVGQRLLLALRSDHNGFARPDQTGYVSENRSRSCKRVANKRRDRADAMQCINA